MRVMIRCAVLTLCVACVAMPMLPQDGAEIICPACKQPNSSTHTFCTSCGIQLPTDRSGDQVQLTEHSYRVPSRLFSVPTAQVLPEMNVALTLGNSFGLEVGESILGTLGFGLGNIAEVEVSTLGLIAGLATGETLIRTAGLKVQILSAGEVVPSVGLALRSSNDWERESRNEDIIRTFAAGEYREGLRGLDYEAKITSLSFSLSKPIHERTRLHAGVSVLDVRYRNVQPRYVFLGPIVATAEVRKTQWHGYGGFEYTVNKRTLVLAEIQSLPFFDFNVTRNQIVLRHMYAGAVGLRYAASITWSVDVALRYQSNFVGLADTQYRVALNGVFNIGS